MTDNTLEDGFLGEGAFDESDSRREFIHVLGVAQPVRHDGGRDDDGGITPQRLVAHILEAFVTFKRYVIFVTLERQEGLSPQPAEKMQLDAFFGKAMFVVEDFFFVKIAFDENSDLLPLQHHGLSRSYSPD